ncbi:hypothetical protein COX24_02755 [bacterium (Candidatus Gribaldobacteria) CG23_combo_of_CG06-09_8_20_14_all_37_87_8]|uniref:Uncharacterized protein n=2 Tax=Candidatus Gribaldobacteria TaxID=2798536 RepID=A0A2G9ZEJ1_9BACT|nr:MAG: hypothetical protein AUJ25_00810 [Parcubacteria group bacterium CG1_02_37_13]PIP31584.1 MAG: hypothetical protein COX24_02755 [bacterium (Candidatus Gribaldobacteria) CG23_combo_of_CG06-09_8_20_14_all_37_87_8]PIR90274.1 MAG: hypothetical protein COU05_02560 [bacterium (Candidatus Gribaldobacteria) CG10_big_fil_rev_8_21_14_0_10_37_21]
MPYKRISLILFSLTLFLVILYFFQVSQVDVLSWQIKQEGFSQGELGKFTTSIKSQVATAESLDLMENNELLSGFVKVEQIVYLPIKPALLVQGN